jgi:hypothetical protein
VKLAEAPSDSAILENLKQDTAEDMTEDTASTPDVGLDEEDDVDEDDVCSTSSSEPDEEDDEDEEEEEEDSDEEDDEEEQEEPAKVEDEEEVEDIEEIKIKKVVYYWSPSSKRVYEHLDEGYGDCIGTYVDGKIVPK